MLDIFIEPAGQTSQTPALEDRAGRMLARQGRRLLRRFAVDGRHLAVYASEREDDGRFLHVEDEKNFAVACGTLIYRGAGEAAGLRALYDDLRHGRVEVERLYGHYCVAVALAGRLYLLTDALGTYHVWTARHIWTTPDPAVISTSFLALCEALDALSLSPQEIYEYVFQGAFYGDRTPLAEIGLLPPGTLAPPGLDAGALATPERWDDGTGAGSLDAAAESWRGRLDAVFGDLAQAFGGRLESSLSGGYDSRLILACLLERQARPGVHVYGGPDSQDVRIARQVCAAAGLDLRHEDKGAAPMPEGDAYAAQVRRNFLAFDGLPTDGIFEGGEDLRTRSAGMADGRLLLNGGGGEVFRNFFYLRDRRYSARELVQTFYCRFDPRAGSVRFDPAAYMDALAAKIGRAVAAPDGGRMARWRIDLAYPAVRGRYWTAKNITLNNRLGLMATPFFFPQVALRAVHLPLAWKNAGRLEQKLIAAAAPEIAAVETDYGFPLDRPPPPGFCLKHWLNIRRPPLLRQYVYRLKARLQKPEARPEALHPQALAAAMDAELPWMRRYLHPERITDPDQFQRLCTLEYLCQQFDGKLRAG